MSFTVTPLPVTEVDGKAVGDGAVGPVTGAILELYWGKHEDPGWTQPVEYGVGV
jgi:branched-chain amino acid aminotransferase